MSMKILVSGSSGFIGSSIINALTKENHTVTRLVRPKHNQPQNFLLWDPPSESLNCNELEGFDAVIHLAGENIAEGRWNSQKKERIYNSRIQGTHLLAKKLAQLSNPPKVLLSASAIAYYGNRQSEILDENSTSGTGFLAQVCRDWEIATAPAQKKGIRVVFLRFGMILSTQGGALTKMLPPFRLGVGGTIGNGQQYISWISLDDAVNVILSLLSKNSIKGPVNVVSPNPVTNRELSKTLGALLKRPTILPLPAFAARLVFGEMANELLLASTRVKPSRLLSEKSLFRHPALVDALTDILNKTSVY